MSCSEVVLAVCGLATLGGTGYFGYQAIKPDLPGEYALVEKVSKDMVDFYKHPAQYTLMERRDGLEGFMDGLTEASAQAPAARDQLIEIVEDLSRLKENPEDLNDPEFYGVLLEHIQGETKAVLPRSDKGYNWLWAGMTLIFGFTLTGIFTQLADEF
jgi:hypothetical protein